MVVNREGRAGVEGPIGALESSFQCVMAPRRDEDEVNVYVRLLKVVLG